MNLLEVIDWQAELIERQAELIKRLAYELDEKECIEKGMGGKQMIDSVIAFFRGMLPTGPETVTGAAVSCIGTAFSHFIGWDAVIETLLAAMAIDYITGVLAAYINPHLALNSQKGFKGICKKIVILLLVALAHEIDVATGQPAVQSLVTWFFIGNEGLSIVENASKAGLPIPKKLQDTLEQLTDSKKENSKEAK